MVKQLHKLDALLEDNKIDAVLINEKVTKRYLDTLEGSGCHILVTRKESFLILDGRYIAEAQEREKDLEIILWNAQDEGSSYLTWVLQYMKQNQLKSIGVETSISIQDYRKFETALNVHILSDAFERLRMIKPEKEIQCLKNAIHLTDIIYSKVLDELILGMSDYEISAKLQYYAIAAGAEKMSFDTIINLGERTAYPHGRPVGRRISPKEMIMIDFGFQFDGFQSDMTRMVSFGEPSAQMREIYEIVLEANIAGSQAMKPGVLACEADAAARSVIEKAGYGQHFTHGLGHGIGMDNATELPKVHAKSNMVLEEGMVMSCEPGIYIPDIGGVRIEDNIWIHDGKGIQLNQTSKELKIL